MNAPFAHRGPLRGDLLAMGAAALICVSLYFAIASENREIYRSRPVTYFHYNSLVDGFLAGHLYMGVAPGSGPGGPEVLQDTSHASLYKGRYYLYFGVAPAVVLFLPWKVLTGAQLAQYWAAAMFVSAGYLASVALLGRLKREYFPGVSPLLLFASALLLGLINWWPLLLSRVGVWEVPIASAYCFAMLTVLFIHVAAGERRGAGWLAAASLSCGLAIASRPNYVLGSAVLALPLLYLWWTERASPAGRGAWTGRLCAALLPIACIGALVGSYNFLRFGSAFEIGARYITTPDPLPAKGFSLSYAWTNVYLYFLAPAHFSPWFPFFKLARIPVLPSGHSDPDDMYGVVANMPVVVLAAAGMWLGRIRRGVSGLNLTAGAMTLLFLTVAGVLMIYCGANNRYAVDVMCGVPVLTILGIWALESRAGARKGLARALWGALAAYSVMFTFCAGIGRDEIFRSIHPQAYRALAHALDLPSLWYDRIKGVEYGPLSLTVRFPAGRPGANEPIVVTGWGPWSNVLFVHYTDGEHVQFGLVGATATEQSAPLRIDYGAAHTLRISMGSLYPPRESPFFDSLGRKDADNLSGTLLLAVDGATILRQRAYFFDAVARKPEIGEGPPVLGRAWAFTGSLTGD